MNFYRRPDPVKLLMGAAACTVLIQYQHDCGGYAVVSVTRRVVGVHYLVATNQDAAHSQFFDLPEGLHDGRAWNLIELICFLEVIHAL